MQMQETVGRILEGSFEYEKGSLDFSCEKLELLLKKGEQKEGAFRILAPPGVFADGIVVSSDWRMQCLTGEFAGSDEEILYCFHGEYTEEGEVVKGSFQVVSNQGEYYLPFVATVEYTAAESSEGKIKNLFHFANLARSSWQEAVRLFYSSEFLSVLNGNDAVCLDDYRALSVYPGQEQNVEEFLIQAGKKQKMQFMAEEEELFVAADRGAVLESSLDIVRNGWGYTRLYVECRGGFLFAEKEVLTDDDFLGNRCRLPVFVDGKALHRGQNFGQIWLYNSYLTIVVPVKAQLESGLPAGTWRLDKKRCVFQLMVFYQAFRMHKIGTATWLKETGRLVEKMVAEDENDIAARLFQAQLLITEERIHEAGWILDYVSDLFGEKAPEDALRAYYLYLTTLIHTDAGYISGVASEVERIYRRDERNWRVAWLLLYLSEHYYNSSKSKWSLLEKLFRTGCSSPVLYIEALALLNANPSLLRSIGKFERQVLYYGAKQGILRQELADQAVYLAGRVKEYSEVLLHTLEKIYERAKNQETLREICALLIKGGRTGKRYLSWYWEGVEAQLRLTNLYEYYIMSLDPDVPCRLPKAVLMYFSYRNTLDDGRAAYLYAYILEHQEELRDIFENCKQKMEYFVLGQIKKGRMSRHLASLYKGLLKPGMVDEQTSEPLSRLLFAHEIRIEDDRIRKVYVYQPGKADPAEYVVSGNRTWVSLYGNRYTIAFEDAVGNRFVKSVEYTMEKLMIPGKYMRWLLSFENVCPEFDLYLCDRENGYGGEGREDPGRILRAADSGSAEGALRRDLYLRVLRHYCDMDDAKAMERYLGRIPVEEFSAAERGEIAGLLVLKGNYDLAEQWMYRYGPYCMDEKALVRLLGILIEKYGRTEKPVLLASAEYVFRKGKFSTAVLEYLILHYRGMAKSMRDMWKAGISLGLDCCGLSERILVQMLYSGAFVGEKMEIFRYYISRGAKPEIEQAFLAQCSFDYFVRERVTEEEVFREIRQMYLRGEPVMKVCRLAYLKFCAENRQERDRDESLVRAFLKEMAEEGIYLDFFREFSECGLFQEEMADKSIIEYRAEPGAEVYIHYTILDEDGREEGYRSECMKEAYTGVWFKEFILFFGENLQYYITEIKDGKEQLTESRTFHKNDRDGGPDSRYRMINDIAVSRSEEDFDTMDDLMEEYYKRDFLNGKLFGLK